MFTINMDSQTEADLEAIQNMTGLSKKEIIQTLIQEKAEDLEIHEYINIWIKKKEKK